MKALLSPAYAKLSNVPSISDEASAEKFLNEMIPSMFYLRAERGDHLPPPPGPSGASASTGKQPRALRIAQAQRFKQDEYFVWFVPASQLKTTLGAVGLVLAVLAGCMFPLWPIKLRIGVWYLSVGVLGLIGALVVIAIIRLIVWGITKLTLKPGIWIFPRLFDDLGVVCSFPTASLSACTVTDSTKKKRLNLSSLFGDGMYHLHPRSTRSAVKKKTVHQQLSRTAAQLPKDSSRSNGTEEVLLKAAPKSKRSTKTD